MQSWNQPVLLTGILSHYCWEKNQEFLQNIIYHQHNPLFLNILLFTKVTKTLVKICLKLPSKIYTVISQATEHITGKLIQTNVHYMNSRINVKMCILSLIKYLWTTLVKVLTHKTYITANIVHFTNQKGTRHSLSYDTKYSPAVI